MIGIFLIILVIFAFSFVFLAQRPDSENMAEGGENSPGPDFSGIMQSFASLTAERSDVLSVKLPKFFRDDPTSYFIIIESAFENARITTQKTKAHRLISALDPDLIPHVKDIIIADPAHTDLYDQIKKRLIAAFSVSSESRLRRLLSGQVVADGKPSLLLMRLRDLNDGECSEAVLKSIFLEQLPANIRGILVMANVADLQDLAQLADKVAEATRPTDFQPPLSHFRFLATPCHKHHVRYPRVLLSTVLKSLWSSSPNN